MSLLKSFYSAIGSHSSDIPSTASAENPLPPCPRTPNCVCITKTIGSDLESAFGAAQVAIKSMTPEKITVTEKSYKITTVFKVFFFRDDLSLQLTQKDATSTYLHIRSASREGFTDLGVNSRRVKRFLKRLQHQL